MKRWPDKLGHRRSVRGGDTFRRGIDKLGANVFRVNVWAKRRNRFGAIWGLGRTLLGFWVCRQWRWPTAPPPGGFPPPWHSGTPPSPISDPRPSRNDGERCRRGFSLNLENSLLFSFLCKVRFAKAKANVTCARAVYSRFEWICCVPPKILSPCFSLSVFSFFFFFFRFC